jgi:hypothetical protein
MVDGADLVYLRTNAKPSLSLFVQTILSRSRCASSGAAIANHAVDAYLNKAVNPVGASGSRVGSASMFKALLRLLSMIALAVAVIMTVLDATRSIAAEALTWTPLGVSWAAVSPVTLVQVQELAAQALPDNAAASVLGGILQLPGAAVFAVLALLLALLGRKRVRQESRFTAR